MDTETPYKTVRYPQDRKPDSNTEPELPPKRPLNRLGARLYKKPFHELSGGQLVAEARHMKDPKPEEVTPGEWEPKPFSQAAFEESLLGSVSAGVITAENADRLARRVAKMVAEGELPSDARLRQGRELDAAQRRELLLRRLLDAGVPESYWNLRIDLNPFLTERGVPYVLHDSDGGTRQGFLAARRLAALWEPGARGFTLCSPGSGVGKTLLAAAVAVYVAALKTGKDGRRAASVRFVKSKTALDLWRESYGATWASNPGVLSTEQVKQALMVRPDVLVLDELGGEYVKPGEAGEWARQMLLEMIDYRIEHRLTTVITTNLVESEIDARYGRRFVSRLLGFSPVVMMGGPDFRQDAPSVIDESDPFAG